MGSGGDDELCFGLDTLRVVAVECPRCVESFPRPRLAMSLDSLACPRCGNVEGNTPVLTIADPAP